VVRSVAEAGKNQVGKICGYGVNRIAVVRFFMGSSWTGIVQPKKGVEKHGN